MKIISICVKNFRPIENIVISGPLEDIWTLVGQNSVGKSAVFNAIRAFYGDYKITLEDFNKLDTSELPIEITVEYLLENEEEIKSLPSYYLLTDNRLRVVKRFTRDNLKGSGNGFEMKDGQEIERDEEFFGAKNVQVGKLGNIIFIPAIKDLSDELKNNNYSLFRKLLGRVISEALTDLPSYKKISKDALEFVADVKSPTKRSATNEIRSLDEIQEALDRQLQSWGLKTDIKINIPTPEEIIVEGADLRFINNITNLEEDPLMMGSGAQRSIVNNLVMLWAKIENQKPKTEKKIFHSELSLLLYEEPESLLHYDQEKNLLRNLEKIAKSPNNQVMICTHSPNLLSTKLETLKSLTRFVKQNGKTKVHKANETYIKELESNRDNFDFTLWLNPDRNTMFFVDKVVLVEGTGDKAFLNFLINESNFNENLFVIDCGWKGSIPLFMKLTEQFGIQHYVMFDRDGDKVKQSVDHSKLNKAIEETKNSCTIKILSFPEDLETYVGFFTTDGYKKPVEILRQLREGKLKNEYKKEFIEFLMRVE